MFVYGSKSSCCPYLLGHCIGHDASKLLIELLIILFFLTYAKCYHFENSFCAILQNGVSRGGKGIKS